MHAKRGVQVLLYETCTGMEMSATSSVQLRTPAALRATYEHLEPTRLGGGPRKSDCDRVFLEPETCRRGELVYYSGVLVEKRDAGVKMATEREEAGPIQGQACCLLLSHGPPRLLTIQNRMDHVSLFHFCHMWCCMRVGPRTGRLGPRRALLQPFFRKSSSSSCGLCFL